MLDILFGNKSIEKILLFLILNEKCYASQLQQLFEVPLTPIQQGLIKLEKAEILTSSVQGKTRFFQLNPSYPLLKELESLLKKAYSLLPTHVQKKFCSLHPHRTTKPFSASFPSKAYLPKETLNKVWKRLLTIQHLSFSAKSKSPVKSGWNGVGKGSVELKLLDNSSCIYYERGTWSSQEDQQFDFSNVFRWTLDRSAGVITLEHLRFGPQSPVFLFNLVPVAENILESIYPYICNEDTYFGQLTCDEHFLQLSWRTLGPKKNEEINYLYT
jgi:hypothetical protein